jgi:hypothetical protein
LRAESEEVLGGKAAQGDEWDQKPAPVVVQASEMARAGVKAALAAVEAARLRP